MAIIGHPYPSGQLVQLFQSELRAAAAFPDRITGWSVVSKKVSFHVGVIAKGLGEDATTVKYIRWGQ